MPATETILEHPSENLGVRPRRQPGDRILEVGVGTGLTPPYRHRQARVTGIDLSERMLDRAARVCQRYGFA